MGHISLRLLATSLVVGAFASPPVKINLRSSWNAPSALVEAIESVASENSDAFFPLVDLVTHPDTHKPQSNEATYGLVFDTAVTNRFLVAPGALDTVKMNIALHAATPKIEAFYEHYSSLPTLPSNCESWVEWYGEAICDADTLARLAGVEAIEASAIPGKPLRRPTILSFDHIYPPPYRTLERPARTAILYASLASKNFRELHETLLALADAPSAHIEYVFRHVAPKESTGGSHLSGFGVALDLKKTDYLAVDDRNANMNQDNREKLSDDELEQLEDAVVSLIQQHPENITAPDSSVPLTEEELYELGYQSAQLIADSPTPLQTLKQLSQNFPKYAGPIARRVVTNETLAEGLHQNQLKAQGGANMAWLNGVTVPDKDINPFAFLRLLRKERDVIQSLTSLGLSNGEAIELLTYPALAESQADGGLKVLDGIFDASDRPEGGDVAVWWNDIEKDARYSTWPTQLITLLRQSYGQFPTVKRNLFNIVLALDLSQSTSVSFIAGPVSSIINRNFPFTFGLVPLVETEEGTRMARLFHYLIANYGRAPTMEFFSRIAQDKLPQQYHTPTVNWRVVRAEFESMLTSEEAFLENQEKDFLKVLNTPLPQLEKVPAYVERLSLGLSESPQGHAFVNGKHFNMDEGFLRSMQSELGQEIKYLQELLYASKLDESEGDRMSTYFYDLPTSNLRRNRHIFPSSKPGSLRVFNLPELFSSTGYHVSPLAFVYPPESDSVPLSIYVVADLDSKDGLQLVQDTLQSVEPNSLARITFVHNPATPTAETISVERSETSRLLAHLVVGNLLSKADPVKLLTALGLRSPSVSEVFLSQEDAFKEITEGFVVGNFDEAIYLKFVHSGRLVARELGIQPGKQALLINGRVVGPLAPRDIVAADFKSLTTYEHERRTKGVFEALNTVMPSSKDYDTASSADLAASVSSIIASTQVPDPSEAGLFDTPYRPRQRNYQLLAGEHTSFSIGDNTTALYQLAFLVDPLSESAQRWSSLIEWLSALPDVHIEVYMNPARYKEIPLKRFYRYNVIPTLKFDEDGNEVPANALFEGLPEEPIYTLAMDVPSSWVVRPREALYDLDNIQLGNLAPEDFDRGVEAVFDLDYLVVEGHAREAQAQAPPRGLQLQLTKGDSTPLDDTQVVANLGYFQFKAKPGVFQMEIRKGRGREIFAVESVGNEGWESPSVEQVGNGITVTSFEGLTIYPRFTRQEGMEDADVLAEVSVDDAEETGGFLKDLASSVLSIFKPKMEVSTEVAVPVIPQADINIFTVASGLLYERFASIMIVSVMRNTNSTVKFWFIENFLSPSFLEFIPHMAEQYGFQYELVTYKWPSWLRAQKEKQRIIWAYKILFLDVLFPMDLKKVIFVDADQIVRADLKELVDIDLQGAPYGYTPMGDDNTDMEGFRFWKTGYWKDFLQGRPYHISALYVVDLVRFRQIAAGDMLRGQYQSLSGDPNSLANLDQDLPNNLQREVPIFSLGEDWLWCETWCSKDRLHRAKTIDLCQNPLTKEPKLARARQIPEWEEYDNEIATFTRGLAEKGLIHSKVAIADTNALAGAPVIGTKEVVMEDVEEKGAPRDEL